MCGGGGGVCGGEAAVSVLVWFLSSGPLTNPQLHFLTNTIKRYLTEAQGTLWSRESLTAYEKRDKREKCGAVAGVQKEESEYRRGAQSLECSDSSQLYELRGAKP